MNQPFYCTEEGKKRLRILVILDGVMILLLLGNLAYIEGCIRKALTSSEDIRLLKMIPGAGKMITRRVENMATDIAFHTVDKIFRDIHAPEKDDLFFDAVFYQ